MDVLNIYRSLYRYFGSQYWWPIQESITAKRDPVRGRINHREAGSRSWENQELRKFEICVGAILTQNTAWKNVEKAISNLRSAGVMNPKKILRIKEGKLASLIRPAGYYNQKAKKLKIFSKWFLRFGQDKKYKLLELRRELLNLWGVGPETADSIALYAYGLPTFVVDAYTKRLCALFGLNFINYDKCKKYFEDNLSRSPKLYNEYHALIVAWGKMFSKDKTTARKILLTKNRVPFKDTRLKY